jgi:hypothetical protein
VFVRSGEAAPHTADKQTPYASVSPKSPMIVGGTALPNGKYAFMTYVKLLPSKHDRCGRGGRSVGPKEEEPGPGDKSQ